MTNKTLEIVKCALRFYLGVPMPTRMHGEDAINDALTAVTTEHPTHPSISEEVRIVPVVSDKAVCPKCGCKMTAKRVLESISEWIPGTHKIDCVGCKEEFEITVVPLSVISPPGETKVTP